MNVYEKMNVYDIFLKLVYCILEWFKRIYSEVSGVVLLKK